MACSAWKFRMPAKQWKFRVVMIESNFAPVVGCMAAFAHVAVIAPVNICVLMAIRAFKGIKVINLSYMAAKTV